MVLLVLTIGQEIIYVAIPTPVSLFEKLLKKGGWISRPLNFSRQILNWLIPEIFVMFLGKGAHLDGNFP